MADTTADALPSLQPDPVIDAYKDGIDRSLLRERLKRTPAERMEDLVALLRFAEELRSSGERLRRSAT